MRRFARTTAALIAAGLAAAGPAGASVETAWTELGPGGTERVIARTSDSSCPVLTADGQSSPFGVRATPAPPDFTDLVCEGTLPAGTTSASVDGVPVPVLGSAVNRIVVLGDTGCHSGQTCSSSDWPFTQVAASAASEHSDLIIHVGDLLYRSCAGGATGCEAGLAADFFDPGAPLLSAAPLLLVRGNHEACAADGAGWFRYFDPQPPPSACPDFTDPYAVPLPGGPQMIVFDSSNADDNYDPTSNDAQRYAAQFETVSQLATTPSWFLSHAPLWALKRPGNGKGEFGNGTLQAALASLVDPALPGAVHLVVSGHEHFFEYLDFSTSRPTQFVFGDGGTELESSFSTTFAGTNVDGQPLSGGQALFKFGYAVFNRQAPGWQMTLDDASGNPLLGCSVGAQTSCAAPCAGNAPTIVGSPHRDELEGTKGQDVIAAGAGADTIDASGGSDVVCGGPGNDVIASGPGHDAAFGGSGRDSLSGGGGRDSCTGGADPDAHRGCES